MTRHELVARIRQVNASAAPEYLDRFSDASLAIYLERLTRLTGPTGRGAVWVRPDLTLRPVSMRDMAPPRAAA